MESQSWILGELLASAGVVPLAGPVPQIRISSLTDDSRKVQPGACFVAVPGARHDGAEFIDQARQSGAAAVVVGPQVAVPNGVPAVRVGDPRKALPRLAATFHRLNGNCAGGIKLIGVTGTNGKTTVTWLLRSILKTAGNKVAMLGTVEYDLVGEKFPAPLTTPGAVQLCESLAQARAAGAEYAVFEVSSHALDQGRCDGLEFTTGIFTNLTGDHLDYHPTMDAYAAAKKRLFENLSPEATAVINADDPRGLEFAASSRAPITTFGIQSSTVDVRGELQLVERNGTSFVLHSSAARMPVRLPLIGTHNVANALAAAAAALKLGVPVSTIRDGLESLQGVPGRLQRVATAESNVSVLVDYAHTDDALRNVLRSLRPLTPGRLLCVFGCGGDRDRGKRPRMAAAVAELADVGFVTSDNPRSEDPNGIISEILAGFPANSSCNVQVEADRRTAIHRALEEANNGDTVLIAGKGHENYQLIGDKVLHFDDVEVAREALLAARPASFREDVA